MSSRTGLLDMIRELLRARYDALPRAFDLAVAPDACRWPTTRAASASFDGTRRRSNREIVTAVSLCHSTRFTVGATLDSLSQLANGDDRLQSTSTGLDGFRVGDRCGG